MTTYQAELTADSIVVNGHDISNACTGYTLSAEVHDIPRLSVDLLTIPAYNGRAAVTIPGSTRDALIALGWTPPPRKTRWSRIRQRLTTRRHR